MRGLSIKNQFYDCVAVSCGIECNIILSVAAPEMDCHLSDLFYGNVANVCCAMHIRSNKYNEKRLLCKQYKSFLHDFLSKTFWQL